VKSLDEVFWKLDAVGHFCEPTGDGKFGDWYMRKGLLGYVCRRSCVGGGFLVVVCTEDSVCCNNSGNTVLVTYRTKPLSLRAETTSCSNDFKSVNMLTFFIRLYFSDLYTYTKQS
jgi:hypothetical protein